MTDSEDAGCRAGSADRADSSAADGRISPRVLVAQLGARRHYAVPRALWRAGLLDRLVTDLHAGGARRAFLQRLACVLPRPAGLRRLIERSPGEIPGERIAGLAGFALDPRLRRRRGEAATDFWARRNAAFCEAVLKLGLGRADCVYAFNGAALEIFQAAKARGLKTILDQTAAPWRWNAALLRREAARWPGWEALPAELDASGRLSAREEAEWRLADSIVVGSAFAKSALAETGGPAERTAVLGYPAPLGRHGKDGRSERPSAFSRARKLRILFVGTLQLRKGIQYLYEAAGLLDGEPVELLAVGPSHLSAQATALVGERIGLVGRVPRSEVARYYAWADVLVLPTLSEGSANVCWEAIAAGLPVIATAHAGVPVEAIGAGRLVPPQDADALAEAIRQLLSGGAKHGRLPACRQARSLDEYARELALLVNATAGPAGMAAPGVRSAA